MIDKNHIILEVVYGYNLRRPTISNGCEDVKVEFEKGSLCILLIEQALEGLLNKTFDDKCN